MTLLLEEDERYKILEGDAVDRLSDIPSGTIDCIFTSPDPIRTGSDAFMIENILGDKCQRVLRPDGSMFVHMEDYFDENGSLTNNCSDFERHMKRNHKWILRGRIIWYMRQPRNYSKQSVLIDSDWNIMDTNRFRLDYSYIYHFTRARYGYFFDNEQLRFTNSSIYEEEYIKRNSLKEPNRTAFSKSLIALALTVACKPGGTVLDCFAGTGTTGEVAIELGHKFIGIEKDPEQAAIIRERLEKIVKGTQH